MSNEILSLKGIERTFSQGKKKLEVLRNSDLSLNEGEIVALVGPSGSGKSTLLHIAGLLEKPDAGSISICGVICSDLDDDDRSLLRREQIGFVYQYHHLLPEFTALENIIIPQIIAGMSKKEARNRAEEILDWLGLSDRSSHRPARLSGGEQQRIAIGRALSNAPRLLIADEPTGNLDPNTANEVFDILLRLVRGSGLTALIATHNHHMASRMDRVIALIDGQLVHD